MAGGLALSAGGLLSACGGSGDDPKSGAQPKASKLRQGGTLRVGATGGGAEDTIDAHKPTSDPDIMRVWQLYEPLAVRPPDFSDLQMVLAESLEAEKGRADAWIVRLKPGLEFHDGKTVTADDVIFSLRRIINPKDPLVGSASIGYIDTKALEKLDARTVRIPLQFANSTFPEDIGQYFNGIVPVDYDPKKPVGTGAFKDKSFAPGEQSTFVRHANYWRKGEPYADELVIIDFTDATAKVNALLGGQVEAINNVPFSQLASIQNNPKLRAIISQTGSWQPFTMRVDAAPFNDNRVRQAMRLIVDRKQMGQQVLSGQGRVANDLYAPNPAAGRRAASSIPAARSLTRTAPRSSRPSPTSATATRLRCHHHDDAVAHREPDGAGQLDQRPVDDAVVLRVDRLGASYGTTRALLGIELAVRRQECPALVGESGSGKTTLARSIAGLHKDYTGDVRLGDVVLPAAARRRSRAARKEIQYIFQNPYASLNPRRTIGQSIARQPQLLHPGSRADLGRRVAECLERVALASSAASRFPDQLSGGERQRVAIARALAAEPSVLVCDEVTSALDVSVQAAIIELLGELRGEMGLSLLFITHDLALIRTIADRVAVTHKGQIVEQGTVTDLFTRPSADYMRRLLSNTPSIEVALGNAVAPTA